MVLMPDITQSNGETDNGQASSSKCDEYKGTRKGLEGLWVWPGLCDMDHLSLCGSLCGHEIPSKM